jgi:hypothetical protein
MKFLTKCVRFFQDKEIAPKELTWLKSGRGCDWVLILKGSAIAN